MDRIEQRSRRETLSEARSDLYAAQQAEEDPLSHDAIDVDTTDALRLQQETVVHALRRRLQLWHSV